MQHSGPTRAKISKSSPRPLVAIQRGFFSPIIDSDHQLLFQELSDKVDAGGTIPGMESVESGRDAYTDVGGRKRPEQVFERRPRKRLKKSLNLDLENVPHEFSRRL